MPPAPRIPALRARTIPYRPGVTVVKVSGEVDATTSPDLARVLDAGEPAVLVVDLTEVTFLGGSGLRVLIGAALNAASSDRAFGVVAADRTALRLLRMSGPAAAVPVFPSLSDALRELAGRPNAAPPPPEHGAALPAPRK